MCRPTWSQSITSLQTYRQAILKKEHLLHIQFAPSFKLVGLCSRVQNVQSHLRLGAPSVSRGLSGVCLGSSSFFFLSACLVVMFCLWKKRLYVPCRDCLFSSACKNSGNKSRDGEGGCNIRVIIAGAPMAARRANWGHRHPLPRARKWAGPGKARSQRVGGCACSNGAAATVFNREPRRAQTGRSESGATSAPARPDSDK